MPDSHRIHNGLAVKSRSRSPATKEHHTYRTRSPHHHHHRHKHSASTPDVSRQLSYGARQLTKRDYVVFRPMFALYLDIQKQKVLDDMDEVEAKGRWKSFIGKWNRGELAEGWYDPLTLQKAIVSSSEPYLSRDRPRSQERPAHPGNAPRRGERLNDEEKDPGTDSDESVGPALPGKERHSSSKRPGPRVPNLQDLELRRELDAEDRLSSREDLQFARRADRTTQKAALDELAPRPDAGTHERRLEKRSQLTTTLNSFADAKAPGIVDEVPESELLGGGDGISDFKRQKQEFERKKNERESRKEEILRARREEREERLEEYRRKEEGTMEMLKGLARAKFG